VHAGQLCPYRSIVRLLVSIASVERAGGLRALARCPLVHAAVASPRVAEHGKSTGLAACSQKDDGSLHVTERGSTERSRL
jgi:hypothetical protein